MLNALLQKSKDYKFTDAATLGVTHQILPVSPHTYHTHFSHPLFNLLQTGLVKRPLAESSFFPAETILWRADRYWWFLWQAPCQGLNTQSLMYDLLPTVSSQAMLHSRLVPHFYSDLRKVSLITSGILLSWCLLWTLQGGLSVMTSHPWNTCFLARLGRTCRTILLGNI